MIEGLFARFPKTYLMFIDKQTATHWASWKEFCDCTAEEKEKANLRQIFPTEILLDIDQPEEYAKILEQIKEDALKYYAYKTGSRGYHIHLFYDNLAELDVNIRNKIRKIIIRKYGADEAKSSEQGIVAKEYMPHFKTGVEKDKLSNNPGRNVLPENLISKAKDETIRELNILKELKQDVTEQFKDFHAKDKLFLYFLSGRIPENQRKNDVLFKNFGVALVNEGLSVEQIKEIVDPILKQHYPDKKWHEFYGWVLKAIKKEILDYNIFELNEWSKKFGHEVFYETGTHFQELMDGLSIPDLHLALWNENIVGQDTWRQMCLYNLVGAVLDERFEDLRVHIMFSCFSSTGKDEGLNITEFILKDLDLEAGTFSTITDRTLVGAVNAIIKGNNDKYGLFKAGDSITIKGVTHEYKNPIEYGLLKEYRWIGFPEAEAVLKAGAHNTNLQLLLRQAMDKKREVNKGVTGAAITFKTNTTLALATFPLEKLTASILTNGLFQRMLFYHKPITRELHNQIMLRSKEKILDFDSPKNRAYSDALVKKLKELQKYWSENKEEYLKEFGRKGKILNTYLDKKICKLESKYSHLDSKNRMIIDAILRRGLTSVIKKIILLDDLMNEKSLSPKNIDRAMDLFSSCLESATQLVWENRGKTAYIEVEDKLDKNIIALINHINSNSANHGLEVGKLKALMFEKQQISDSQAKRWIDRAEEEGVIKRVKEPISGSPNRTVAYLEPAFYGEETILEEKKEEE